MRISTPSYVQDALAKAGADGYAHLPSGHRFRLYLRGWKDDWAFDKKTALDGLIGVGAYERECVQALNCRQKMALDQVPEDQRLSAVLVADQSFVTGTGIDHPLENGFAFLDPCGVPYLPGSSIKGVVRRAAEELVLLDDGSAWSLADLWLLFGFDAGSRYFDRPPDRSVADPERQMWIRGYEAAVHRLRPEQLRLLEPLFASAVRKTDLPPGEAGVRLALENRAHDGSFRADVHWRGALAFWDAFPIVPQGAGLEREMLNVHYQEYYGGRRAWPSDDGKLNPIEYLAIPAGAEFRFHVVHTQPAGAAAHLAWKGLVQSAFSHAAEWLGFGAKTSTG
ncbi:MAG: type III-B CRISPR module RAMP protein Cmr6, partial [Candidatus Riflebacteria bacterium]|nr:type III-B CRISPR module RAMP protein Cmr6 [Candidatus Riflebacteria bacterium]